MVFCIQMKMLKSKEAAVTKKENMETELSHDKKQIAKAAQREMTLRKIMSSCAKNFEIDKVITSIVSEAGRLFEADRCFFVEYDSLTDSISQVKYTSEYTSSKEIKAQSSRKTIRSEIETFVRTTKQRKITFVEDIEKVELPESARKMLIDDLSVKSYLIMPVFFDETLYGSIVFHYVRNYMKFTDDDINVAQAIAGQFAVVVQQAKLYKAMETQAHREKVLRELISEISSSLDFNEIRRIIVSKLGTALNADLTIIYTLDDSKRNFVPIDHFSMSIASKDIKNPIGQNIAEDYGWKGHILANKKTDIVYSDMEDLKKDYKLFGTKAEKFLEEYGVKSMLALPIIHANDFLGFLVLNFIKECKAFSKEDVNFVKVVSSQAGIELYQAKLYNQAQEASRTKSEFIATMSHELKTPLNIIIGFSDLLSNASIEPEYQQKYLQNINRSGRHLLNLINDILNFGNIESGNVQIKYEDFNLRSLIVDAVQSMKLIYENKKINIEIDVTETKITSDKKILTQILYNLLSNAIKYTKDGGSIAVKTEVNDEEISILVEDTGIGIEAKNINLIFEKFKQIDSSFVRKQEGTGLGLSIAKKLVEMLNGTIHVRSSKGAGSCFWFTLPKN